MTVTATSSAAPAPERFIRPRECSERVGLSRWTIDKLERAGKFPKRRRLSVQCVGWLESDVTAWINAR